MLSWLRARLHRRRKPPEVTQAIDEVTFVVVDLETTGLTPQADGILAIGAIRMQGSRILVGETFYRLVQPEQATWPETIPFHQIFPEDVSTAPPLADILPEFVGFCQGAALVGYAVGLDRTFLAQAEPGILADYLWMDVRKVAGWLAGRRARPGETLPEHDSLDELASHYQVSIPLKHQALADAFVTAQIWQQQLSQLKAQECQQLHQLVSVGCI